MPPGKSRQRVIEQSLQRNVDGSTAKRIAAEHGLELATRTEAGHPAQTIVRVAKEGGYDLVAMGHTGHSNLWGTFMGTTAEKVTRHLTCSVLVVR